MLSTPLTANTTLSSQKNSPVKGGVELKKFYCFTVYGEGLPVCEKLQEQGVEVKVGIIEDLNDTCIEGEGDKKEKPEEKKKRLSLYDGILDKMSVSYTHLTLPTIYSV